MSCDCNTLVVGEAGAQGPQGLSGTNGTNGTNGINAFTTLSTTFTQPNVYPTSGYDVTITVAENSWVSVGQGIYIQSAGYYTVNSLAGTTQISVRLRQTSGISSGASVSSGRKISPSAFAIYSSPLASLRVDGDLSQSPDVILDGNVTINGSKNARDLIVKGDTADYLLVTKGSTDRVGINIASPTTTLDVAGTLKASGTVDFGGAVTVNSSNGSNDFTVKTSGPNTTLFVKGSSSRVGVGTTSPDELLHVAGKIKSDTVYVTDKVGIKTSTPTVELEVTGGVKITGYMTRGAPVTKTADFTVAVSENWLINNKSGSTCIVTLPSASTYSGREITIKTTQAQTVISASSNVISLDGTTTSTAILPATIGKWATLVSNGTSWVIMASN
jgi:cytoskeletal protein CcmA (bactofilin family)